MPVETRYSSAVEHKRRHGHEHEARSKTTEVGPHSAQRFAPIGWKRPDGAKVSKWLIGREVALPPSDSVVSRGSKSSAASHYGKVKRIFSAAAGWFGSKVPEARREEWPLWARTDLVPFSTMAPGANGTRPTAASTNVRCWERVQCTQNGRDWREADPGRTLPVLQPCAFASYCEAEGPGRRYGNM